MSSESSWRRPTIAARGPRPGGTPVSTFACDGETVSLFELEGPHTGAASPLSSAPAPPAGGARGRRRSVARSSDAPQTELSYAVKGSANRLSGVHPLLGNVVVERLGQDRWVWSLPDEAVRVAQPPLAARGLPGFNDPGRS